ncbi:MAG TPA: hypothetical protein PKD61_31580 [Polyangiaceae bacterium]|nr:hypothetical protein [Polyangiaceae bacterium]
MNHKTKIAGAVVLVLAGVGIWVPQLPGLFGGKRASAPPEVAAEPALGERDLDAPQAFGGEPRSGDGQ